jgi:hypothetical protein
VATSNTREKHFARVMAVGVSPTDAKAAGLKPGRYIRIAQEQRDNPLRHEATATTDSSLCSE